MTAQATQFRPINLTPGERSRRINLNALMLIIKHWHARARQRRQLAQLPAEMLKDIGVSRADALNEASKPFWRS
ncbi:DUF1127 domain-containing protein [Marinobacterium lutimaris]|uniref:Uncharacterized conserved protein YjiS, DUF1127 family n=1 Tax=Marinobacterium lutimaris TaxID=568106 RepID=A0A1H5X788_9GAMM|nr:DUF1127 domain-containing protein [Marinobacterium lutimaris]SEG07582.1 Uncharacterized conserved protein YjiS, DUF1127 family [Marinobacterium lutimaris]